MTQEIAATFPTETRPPLPFTPDSKRLVCQRNGQVESSTFQLAGPCTSGRPPSDDATAMAISPDGQTLYTGHVDGWFWCFELSTGRKIGETRRGKSSISGIRASTAYVVVVVCALAASSSSVCGKSRSKMGGRKALARRQCDLRALARTATPMPL